MSKTILPNNYSEELLNETGAINHIVCTMFLRIFSMDFKKGPFKNNKGKFKIKATQICKIDSRYLKPIYAKPANLNKISNQNRLIKTKSNPSI